MKVIKEQVVGTRGNWVVRVRLVEYVTKERGRFNRPELLLSLVGGAAGDDTVGFSMEELQGMQSILAAFAAENFCS